mmetsp:Transcript_18345/g.37977  ORF Transcript_18345/g.37977 Transcript_18345/m.37977 type:complete len:119 (-) Transcript_18345:24-380(-)
MPRRRGGGRRWRGWRGRGRRGGGRKGRGRGGGIEIGTETEIEMGREGLRGERAEAAAGSQGVGRGVGLEAGLIVVVVRVGIGVEAREVWMREKENSLIKDAKWDNRLGFDICITITRR